MPLNILTNKPNSPKFKSGFELPKDLENSESDKSEAKDFDSAKQEPFFWEDRPESKPVKVSSKDYF
jgi:hypothetical protein